MKKITPETAIKGQIKGWLSINGWFHFHILQGLGAFKGCPDIVAIKDGLVLFIEVKTDTGKQSANQEAFEHSIVEQGGHYLIARGYEDILDYLNNC